MDAANRDVDRFAFTNGSDFRSDSGSGRAAHHDPVFRTVRRQAARIDAAASLTGSPKSTDYRVLFSRFLYDLCLQVAT